MTSVYGMGEEDEEEDAVRSLWCRECAGGGIMMIMRRMMMRVIMMMGFTQAHGHLFPLEF